MVSGFNTARKWVGLKLRQLECAIDPRLTHATTQYPWVKKRSTTKTTSLQPPVQQHFCSALFSVPRSLLFAATRKIEIHGIHACVCEFDDALLVMTLLEKDWGEELCSEKLNSSQKAVSPKHFLNFLSLFFLSCLSPGLYSVYAWNNHCLYCP